MATLKNCPRVWVFMKFSIPSTDGKMLKTKTSSSCPRPKLLKKGAFIWGTCVERLKTPSPCIFGQSSITTHFTSLIYADISAENLRVGIVPHMQNHDCVREEGLWLLCSGWCTGSGSKHQLTCIQVWPLSQIHWPFLFVYFFSLWLYHDFPILKSLFLIFIFA